MNDTSARLRDLRIDRDDLDRSPSSRGFAVVVGLLLVAALVAAGWWWRRGASPPVVETAVAEAPSSASGATVLDASGYVVARRRATVSSKVTGKILEITVEEGQRVSAGQVLARLDASLPERQLDLARAQATAAERALDEMRVRLAEAELDVERMARLRAEAVQSQAELDRAEASRDAWRARLATGREDAAVARQATRLREQELEDTVIRAPFDGMVVTKDAQEGEMISPVSAGGGFTRTGICTLVDMTSLEIEVDVNEAYIHRVHDGQRAEAVLDAYPDWRIPAHVITTIPTADRQKATVRVRVAFDVVDPRMLPEMGVKVSFLEPEAGDVETGDVGADEATPVVATVPVAALRREDERDVVFVVRGDRLERRAVTIAGRSGDRAELAAGISPGDRVVVGAPPGFENALVDGLTVTLADESTSD